MSQKLAFTFNGTTRYFKDHTELACVILEMAARIDAAQEAESILGQKTTGDEFHWQEGFDKGACWAFKTIASILSTGESIPLQ